jgi:D-alanine--poly(phosphoribitol) ligase subunit 2
MREAVASIMSTEAGVLSILQQITGTDQVQRDLDLPLFDRHVLDSLGMVELMIRLSEEFKVDISPAEIDRTQWASPRLIIEDMQRRVGQ